jgi:hypothetical protein
VITTDGNTYTGTLGASTPQPIEGESSNANQGKGIEAGNLYAASVQMESIPYITFTTIGEQEFKLSKVNSNSGNIPSTFQYSADGGLHHCCPVHLIKCERKESRCRIFILQRLLFVGDQGFVFCPVQPFCNRWGVIIK